MIKIFLVEDEFVVREGIKNKVDWNAHGYEFCGEASDGELAFPMIQKSKPDIVVAAAVPCISLTLATSVQTLDSLDVPVSV